MNKNLLMAVLLLLSAFTASNIAAYGHYILPTNTVKDAGGKVHFGILGVDWGYYDFDINAAQIGWDVGGQCASMHRIELVGGKYGGEFIQVRLPDGDNFCKGRTLYLGTVAEMQQKQTELKSQNINSALYPGSKGLAILERSN